MDFFKTMLCGAVIGLANIIPGVSGGTMAVILNIYDELISSISDFRTSPIKSIKFLTPIGLGAVIAILLCSSGLSYLLDTEYMIVNFFFIGIIIGSVPMLYSRATKKGVHSKKVYTPMFITFALMMLMVIFSNVVGTEETIIRTLSPITFLQLFLASAVAAICMIVPGVSGSFVMLLFGVYTTIITAISEFNILLLATIGIGVLAGIFGGAKLIDTIIEKHETPTYFAILGLVFGSIPVLLNNIRLEDAFFFNSKLIISFIALFVGYILTSTFDNPKLKEYFTNKKSSL